MFEEQNNKQPEEQRENFYYQERQTSPFSRGALIIFLAAIFVLFVGFVLVWKYFPKKEKAGPAETEKTSEQEITATTTVAAATSTPKWLILASSSMAAEEEVDLPSAENIAFGSFYKNYKKEKDEKIENILNLPLDAKTEVANYYDIARKINLDSSLTDLNSNGFVVLNNIYGSKANDFFFAYEETRRRDIPILITGDFLLYYYHNIAKEAFNEIQSEIFYQKIWNINKKMFEIANARYRARKEKEGIANNPILEAERMEVAYFATALELLDLSEEEKKQEINISGSILGGYNFSPPSYLAQYVKKEVDLIKEANKIDLSPIFLYYRDYKDFAAPAAYNSDYRLKHFYLATKWLNSNFPLYEKSADCSDCLLDKADWRVSFLAANFIAEDFKNNQDLANDWAKIYKVLSFFSGLRRDLTYISYRKAAAALFGDDYEIEKIFAEDVNSNWEKNILRLRDEIGRRDFLLIQGGFERSDEKEKKKIGMRILQDPFWPGDYVFKELIYPKVGTSTFEKPDKKNITFCPSKIKDKYLRCRPISLDIINLFYPLGREDQYFLENANYENYFLQADRLKSELKKFNIFDWHSNIFWADLSIADAVLRTGAGKNKFFTSPAWQKKNINSVLGAWTDLQLSSDIKIISAHKKVAINKLGSLEGNKTIHYVEPNLVLVDELLANAAMLKDSLYALSAIQKTNKTYGQLSNFIAELESIKKIIRKEIKGEALDEEDQKNILDLVGKEIRGTGAPKTLRIGPGKGQSVFEKIEGVKLLLIAYKEGGNIYFALGPVFDYKESK
jgi:hypothetical protein